MDQPQPTSSSSYRRPILLSIGLVVLVAVVVLAIDIVLVALGAVLYGVLLNGLARWFSDRTPLGYLPSLAIIVVVTPALVVGVGFLLGPHVSQQIDRLVVELPATWRSFEAEMQKTPWLSWLFDLAPGGDAVEPSGDVGGRVTGAFSSVAGWILNVAVVVVVGIYLAVAPGQYLGPMLQLLPRPSRPRGREVLAALRCALWRWLIGRIVSMILVGVLTTLGLYALGVPLALVLGVLAGMLAFVPTVGPIAAVVPAALLAWVSSGRLALWVLALYAAVQLVETYLITPFIEKRSVSLPPGYVILTQLLVGVLFGLTGLVIATPIMVIVVVLVQMLYVQQVLGDDVVPLGATPQEADR